MLTAQMRPSPEFATCRRPEGGVRDSHTVEKSSFRYVKDLPDPRIVRHRVPLAPINLPHRELFARRHAGVSRPIASSNVKGVMGEFDDSEVPIRVGHGSDLDGLCRCGRGRA